MRWVVMGLLGWSCFALNVQWAKEIPRPRVLVEMQTALPLFIQVAMAGGDRYLAANLDVFRSLVVETRKMHREDYKVLAKLQIDASWLNPAHEDNYYIATAILPWSGELNATQTILRRASDARPYDYQPSFYHAFYRLYFEHDPIGAAAFARQAAMKLPSEEERLTMENFAARWVEAGDDLNLAIQVVEGMAEKAQRRDFRQYLLMRVERLKSLANLRQAAQQYQQRFGKPLSRLDQLVEKKLLAKLPQDPFGFGFDIDVAGKPIVLNSERKL